MKLHAINALFDSLAESVVPNSCDVVVIEGRLDHGRLRRAIASVLERHPILRSDAQFEPRRGAGPRPKDEPSGPREARPRGPGEAPRAASEIDLRFHALHVDEPARVDAHLLRQIWDEPLGARPVRFHVTETPSRTYLQTIHTHVFADATACYALTEQIAAAYGGHAIDAAEPEPLVWPRESRRARLASRARGLAQTARDVLAPYGGLATPRRARAGRRRMARVVLSEAETKQLRAAARSRNHSIHAFFQLALVRAATAYNRARGDERTTLRLWDFFSLRPMLERGGAPRYDCLALIYPVDLDTRWPASRTIAHCAEVVERMRTRDLLVHARRFDTLFRAAGRVSPMRGFTRLWPSIFKSNVFLTNPGVCPSPLPRFGDAPVVDYVTFPQLFYPADVMFIFSTFRDRLRIHVVYDEDAFGGAFHQDLLAPFLAELDAHAALGLAATPTRDGFVASWTAPAADHDRATTPRAMRLAT